MQCNERFWGCRFESYEREWANEVGAGELVYSKQCKGDWVSRFLETCTLTGCTGSWKAAHYSLEILTFITILPLHSNLPSSSSSRHFEEQVPWSLLKISQMTGLFPALLNSIDRCFGWTTKKIAQNLEKLQRSLKFIVASEMFSEMTAGTMLVHILGVGSSFGHSYLIIYIHGEDGLLHGHAVVVHEHVHGQAFAAWRTSIAHPTKWPGSKNCLNTKN